MKLWPVCLSLLACACASRKPAEPPSEQQMMARWADFMTPSEGHAALKPKVGTWQAKVRMFTTPDAPPAEMTGTSVVQWIMDGRFLQDTTNGDFNGMPFRGLGTTAYDNLKQAYVATWLDNMGTGILYAEGHYDAKTRTFHFESSMPDLMYANEYVPSRSTEHWTDDDHWVMQNFRPGPDGGEFMDMEIEYTRVK